MRPKVKFLTVVWGEVYIDLFAGLSLPSFLAPGNLPALAAVSELEVVVLTARRDAKYFEKHPAFRKLRAICPVRFIDIDDLIVDGLYGVTLTLAYARAIMGCGREMLETHFVFMNADFVLADGSLRSLSKHILAGRSIVLGPSFRASAEALKPQLEAILDRASGNLDVPPRDLAALALPYPHPTTISKTVTQGLIHSIHPNQVFWRVDERTLLGRYYLIFMLCLKPERMLDAVNSWSDYGFIPEMCPSGDEVVMGDSDEFFMLEMQRRDQEMFQLRSGPYSEARMVADLSEWTTAEHRRAAGYDVVFHSGPLSNEIVAAKSEARALVRNLGEKLSAPVPHVNHPYWVGAIRLFQRQRKARGLPAAPPELDPRSALPSATQSIKEWLRMLAVRAIALVFGRAPSVTSLHPDWLDYRHLQAALGNSPGDGSGATLVVRDRSDLIDGLLQRERMHVATLTEASYGRLRSPPGEPGYSRVFVYTNRWERTCLHDLVEQVRKVTAPGGVCDIFIQDPEGRIEDRLLSEMLRYLENPNGRPGAATIVSCVGSRWKRLGSELATRFRIRFLRSRILALPWAAAGLVSALPLVLLVNLKLRRQMPSPVVVPACSSMLIRFGPITHDQGDRESPGIAPQPAATRSSSSALFPQDLPQHSTAHEKQPSVFRA